MNEIKKLLKEKSKAISLGQIKEAAAACNAIGTEYSSQEKYDDALDEHLEELNFCEMTGDQLGIAVANRKVGECYAMLNNFKKALHHVKKFYDLSVILKNTIEEQRAWVTFGRTYFLKYHYECASSKLNSDSLSNILNQAELAYYKALKLVFSLGSEVKPIELAEMKCRCLLNLGLVCDTRGDQKGIKYVKQGLDIALENGLYEDIYRCGYSLGSIYQKTGKHKEALEVMDKALTASKKLHNKTLISEVLLSRGINLMFLEDFYNARICLKSAYKMRASNTDDQEKIEKNLKVCLGIIKCEEKLKSSTSSSERKLILEKIADALSSIACYKLAIKKYLLCLDFIQENSLSQIGPIYYSLAQTYLDDGNIPMALEYFEKELNCHEGELSEQIGTVLRMAEVLEGEKQFDKSEEFYMRGVSLAEKVGDQKLIHTSLYKLLSFYNSTNKINLAQDVKKKLDAVKYEVSEEEPESEEESQEPFDDIHLSELSDSDNNEDIITSTTRKRTKKFHMKVNIKGETLLHEACINNNLNMVKRLVENGHPVNVRDNAGWTPLHEACNYGHYDIVEYLLDNGADINDPGGPDCDGITALHDASSNGNLEVIQILLSRGARVTVKNKKGKTPLETLLKWRKNKREDLDDVTLRQCKAVEDELRSKMAETGMHIDEDNFSEDIHMASSPELRNNNVRVAEKRNRSPSLSSDIDSEEDDIISTPPYLNINDDQDWNNAGGAKAEYKSVMENLRRSAADVSLSPAKNQTPKVSGPSLVNEDEVVNEWLIKDTNEIPKAKRKRRKRSKLNVRTSKCIDKFLIHSDSADEKEINRIYPLIDEDSNASVESTNSVGKKVENTTQSSKSDGQKVTFCLRVRIANKLILIPVPNDTCTVCWLTEEAALRYQNLDGSKPHLTLTKNGALISNSDLIKDIFSNNEEVFSTVDMWDEPSLEDRYVQLCKKRKLAVSLSIKNRFCNVKTSSEVSFSNCNIPYTHLSLIFSTLLNYKSLQHLNFSCTALTDSNINELNACIPSFSSLVSLNLSCCCLTTQIVKIFADYLNDQMSKDVVVLPALKNLDLSNNYFYPCSSFAVFFKLNSLVGLSLASCSLNSAFLANEIIEAIKIKDNIEEFDLSSNFLGEDGISKLLHHLPKKNLKKLNLSHTVDKEISLGLKLQAFFDRSLFFLSELSFQGCYLTSTDLDQISECLCYCPQLQVCNLSANPSLPSYGIHNFISKAHENNLNISDLTITGTCKWQEYYDDTFSDILKFKALKHLCYDNCPESITEKLIQLWKDKWGNRAIYTGYPCFSDFTVN